MKPFLFAVAASLAALLPLAGAQAYTASILFNFSFASYPSGLIADSQGALYGTTAEGCGYGAGTAFKLSPPSVGQTAWTQTVLHAFPGISGDGNNPHSGLTADVSGALYGTTFYGGTADNGAVFRLTPPTAGQTDWSESLLYSFQGGTDGSHPSAGLIAGAQGALYGTTVVGGSDGYSGTVFKLTPPKAGQTSWTETILHSFTGSTDEGPLYDGDHPQSGLIADAKGALYGTTYSGGNGGYGTVFKLTPPTKGQTAWTESILHNFTGSSDGANPLGGLIMDLSGALYGTTNLGGVACGHRPFTPGCGTVFKLTPPGQKGTIWNIKIIHDFKGGFNPGSDGIGPAASLIADASGALYGTTQAGGGGCPQQLTTGCGAVFKLIPLNARKTEWSESVLYGFAGYYEGQFFGGFPPAGGLLIDSTGAIYGSTPQGGGACGSVFKLTP